ncbi:MAG: alcohol dehydrogenase catalytic domain-containing protein [Proteobacteria bacterium]|nr:alcohol dehydrogenase catalytic domain-containing protein [Pseudomonadota bacterium]
MIGESLKSSEFLKPPGNYRGGNRMKAAVYKGKQRFEIEEIPTPSPGPDQVLVKVHFCAICGTDVHAFLYDIAPPGTVLGHEFAGDVVEVGPSVTEWKVGDRVIGGGGDPPPGHEPLTRTHPRYNYRTMGFPEGSIRGYAEYVLMEEWQPILIPDGISDEEAAMCEPTAVAVHAVRNSDLKLGETDHSVTIGIQLCHGLLAAAFNLRAQRGCHKTQYAQAAN